jgi:alginate O-acetyltransferase complex protein AlgI
MRRLEKLPNWIKHIYTMLIVMVGWVFFSIESLTVAIDYLKVMFFISGNSILDSTALYFLSTHIVLLVVLFIASTPLPSKIFNKIKKSNIYLPTLINGLMLFLALSYLVTESYNPFLYFRF